jgi:hypothetical protein
MKKALNTKITLENILKYLSYKEIILLSQSNKELYKKIDPESNTSVNNLFFENVYQCYFFSKDYNFENKKNLLDNFLESKTNWKLFLKELSLNFVSNDYVQKEISAKVLDCFKLHLYLPDLRKEHFHLEYEFSSTHQYVCYDLVERRLISMNRFRKQITKEYLKDSLKNPKEKKELTVKPLRKGEFFEKELLEFSSTYYTFINNDVYNKILGDVINYKYTNIDLYYKNNKFDFNIINFLLWITHSFILYSDYVYNYINIFIDNVKIDVQTLFIEYIGKYEELVNCAQLISSKFENINIMINYLIKFMSLPNEIEEKGPLDLSPSSSSTSASSSNSNSTSFYKPKAFYLYNLFSTITKNNVCNKLSGDMEKKLEKLLNVFFVETFEKKEYAKDENNNDFDCDYEDDNMAIDDENFDNENEDLPMSDEENTNKELLEKYYLIQADQEINEINSKAINHTELKVSKEYENLENLLNDKMAATIDLYVKKEKPLFEIFNIIKKITKSTGNTKILCCSNKSLNLIRRTKKRLMEKSVSTLFKYVLQKLNKDFHQHIKIDEMTKAKKIELSYSEIKNEKKYEMDLNDLDSETRRKVVELVEKEKNNLITFLEEENIKNYADQNHKDEMSRLIKEYADDCRIPYVLLINKIMWYYYKELAYYEERNKIVINYLSCSHKNGIPDDTYESSENILKENLISYNIK